MRTETAASPTFQFSASRFGSDPAHVMTNWDKYLAPRVGAYLVAAWLAGFILDLLLIPGYYDVALRDFGLMMGALALARLAAAFPPRLR